MTQNIQTRPDVAIILGTRPEIIKLADIILELGPRALVIHTGQHWDDGMSERFLRDRGIQAPVVRLEGIGGESREDQFGIGIGAVAKALRDADIRLAIVQGDTNSASMGAQAANYIGLPVVHVEAGLRSHDREMPEEINRLVIGAVADYHCAATPQNAAALLAAGVSPDRVLVTGNTVIEATLTALNLPAEVPEVPERFILATLHRPENTDSDEALERALRGLAGADLPAVFVAHPRTVAAVERAGLRSLMDQLVVLEPVGHATLLQLAARAALVVSDSGGLQEEVTVLKKPLLVVRQSTERAEAMSAGFARLITPEMALDAAIAQALEDEGWEARLRELPSPFGDGTASVQIANLSRRVLDIPA